jgi:hypothetical protein
MNSILLAGLCLSRRKKVHPPNQMRLVAELPVNSNRRFGLGLTVACLGYASIRTSTSKVYFLTVFSVIFADFDVLKYCAFQAELHQQTRGGGKIQIQYLELVRGDFLRGLGGGLGLFRPKILIQRSCRGLEDQLAVCTIVQMLFYVMGHSRRQFPF